uniref:sn-1-specific diacylglycerol lipase ABHD11 n=1 Tax=Monodelphis domestica TaxID=13616 RepID=A0A5F8H4K4_MONDO
MAQQTGRKVLIVDARNHGESPHNPDCSYEAMSADLQTLLPQLSLVPCVLIGHSMGGKTAMILAVQRPELVERLILVDISPKPTTTDLNFLTYLTAMKAVHIPKDLPRSQARKMADKQLSSVIKTASQASGMTSAEMWRWEVDFHVRGRASWYLVPTSGKLGGSNVQVYPACFRPVDTTPDPSDCRARKSLMPWDITPGKKRRRLPTVAFLRQPARIQNGTPGAVKEGRGLPIHRRLLFSPTDNPNK